MEAKIFAREAESQLSREQMLAQVVPTRCALLRRTHPNEGNVKAAIAARDVGSQPAREQMLAHAVPTRCALLQRAHPNERNVEAKIFAREAGNQPAREQMLAHNVLAAWAIFAMRKLKSLHTVPITILPENTCSLVPCPPHGLSSRIAPYYHWGMGRSPMAKNGP